jgi:hypothetical protein
MLPTYLFTFMMHGVAEDRTLGLSLAKGARYHCATTPHLLMPRVLPGFTYTTTFSGVLMQGTVMDRIAFGFSMEYQLPHCVSTPFMYAAMSSDLTVNFDDSYQRHVC